MPLALICTATQLFGGLAEQARPPLSGNAYVRSYGVCCIQLGALYDVFVLVYVLRQPMLLSAVGVCLDTLCFLPYFLNTFIRKVHDRKQCFTSRQKSQREQGGKAQ